ncbi:MAG TPA: AAA family ATPase [Tepidisphaeraceae bacterium]|nr:AAA family ATPase [Tepidisphaeraceae bacterium]
MYVQLNCAIIDSDAENRQELAAFLANNGVQTAVQLSDASGLPNVLNRPDSPVLVIVNLDPHPAEALRKIHGLPRQFPGAHFFLMSQTVDPQLLMDAMHIGAREFLPLPLSQEKFALAVERVAQAAGMGKRARVIQVIPTIGGCGSTTVACNVAASLALTGKTALIDLDLVRGGVASAFDIRPRYTIADVMDAAEKADRQLLDNALTVHPNSKLAILARPDLPEDTQRVSAAGVKRLITVLGRMFDYVVIDSMMSVDPIYAAAISAADATVIVMQLNIPSAKNAERFVGALRRQGIEASKIRLVVNRYIKKNNDIEPEEVQRAMGLKISWMIPNDFKNAIAAINFGEPVVLRAPKSEIAASLVGLAGSLATPSAMAGLAA